MRPFHFRLTIRFLAVAPLVIALTAAGCTQPNRPPASSGTKARPAAAVAAGPGERVPPRPMPRPARAVWVARMHYTTPDDVRTIIRNCAALGINTVLWQVRGEGTVAYPSDIEIWSKEYQHKHPGFDPLAIAVQEAHARNMRIEAWVNVLPGWRGPQPPPTRYQLYYFHPNWFLHDARNAMQPLTDFYAILNPCLPEVRRHIVDVFEEILTRYDVDGLHLDYVRYAWEETPNAARLYPRDPTTLALYKRETGKAPDDDPAAWDGWRAAKLTQLVTDIRTMLDQRRPGATLTAAVTADPARGYREFFQNSVAWLRTGLLDAVMPMAYTEDPAKFDNYIATFQRLAPQTRIIPGLGIYKHVKDTQMRQQLDDCLAWGGDFALFSYESLYVTAANRASPPTPQQQSQRAARREVLAEFVRLR